MNTQDDLIEKPRDVINKLNWLSGGGEMAEFIRAKDWSQTSLGPIEFWPPSLRTTVSLCLASNFPINIIWGPDALQLYSAGYKVLCGEAHPRAIGESYRVTWKSAWPAIGEPFERAWKGETTFLQNQRMFLQRNDYLEETFFTFSLSPIRDESGEVVGLFHPVTETTAAKLSERRNAALGALAKAAANCRGPDEAWTTVINTLSLYRLDLPGIIVFGNDDDGQRHMIYQTGCTKELIDIARWPVEESATSTQPIYIHDLVDKFGPIRCDDYPESVKSACLFPIRIGGVSHPVGYVAFVLSPRLPVDDSYKTFISLLSVAINAVINSSHLNEDAEQERLRLYEVFMQGPIPTAILLGPEHRYAAVNEPYERLVGRPVLGKTVLEAFNPEEIAEFVPFLDQVYQTGRPYTGKAMQLCVPDENGIEREYFLNVGYHPFRDANDKIKGVLAVHVDVTDEVNALKLIAQNETRFRALADSMPVMVWAARPNGEMYYYNQRWLDFTGIDLGENKDTGWKSLVHPDDYEWTLDVWKQCIESEKPLYLELRIKCAVSQEYRWHLSRAEPAKEVSGKIWSWFGTCTDIHVQKMLMQELDVAKAVAEAANLTKSAFLANMSHEIRTPLSAILGFTEILKSPETSTAERTDYLNIIARNGEALVRIIDDILDLSKIEAGKIEIEQSPLCLSELLRDVVAMFTDRAYGKGLALEVDTTKFPPFRIQSDAVRIRQILVNLIGNALKFTTEGSVRIGGSYKETKDGNLRVTLVVSDTGIGLNPEQAKTLFRAFTQADNTTSRRYGGTGLGLALSKKLAKAMGGDISIVENDTETIGTTFKIKFVAAKCIPAFEDEQKLLSHPAFANGKRLNQWRVLVVDDSGDNRALMKILLERDGAVVDEASDGEQGVTMACQNTYDAVLMDIQMPGIDGYEALARLREAHYKRPIFALTAHAMKEEKNRILAKGFSGHISKPVNPRQLFETLTGST